MAGWADWLNFLMKDSMQNTCCHVGGIYGPASAQYQLYASQPANYHPGVEFFQNMDKIFASGVGACGSVTVNIPDGSGQKSMKFMILRETDKCIYAKCGSEAGFNVSKTNNLYVVSFYTDSSVQAGNCTKQNCYVQEKLVEAGQ